MKSLHMCFFLLLLVCVRWATAAEIATNASVTVDFVEAVNNSCMSMVLHNFYTDPDHRPQTPNTSCDSQNSIKEAASSGVFWLQGSTVAVSRDHLLNKTLKIGVPIKNGLNEFMKVERNSKDSRPTVSGFPIDVFDEVMARLPYRVLYEFFPYEPDGDSPASYDAPGYYNSLISQVYFKEYDAVVGDVAITANRSDYVDFTYAYMDAGVSMIVPVRDDDTSGPWWFLNPLTTELWVITLAFSVFKGVLVWFFEHGDNSEFQGSRSQVVGMILYFSFSVFVFANSEKLKKNYSRFVLNVWMFLVFVLVTSYGANLTSMLTVERLQPTITDINQLKKNGDYVGCQKGSFVFDLLTKLGFEESKIKLYGTVEEYADALSKGNDNGGVAAMVDEIPYIKVFLKHHCRKYTKSEWTYRTGGFGFVFPRGSAMLPDISRAVLNFTEGEEMLKVERKWFGDQTKCPDSDTPVDNKRLPLYSLRSIYIIAGVASALALIIYSIEYFCKNKIGGLIDRLMENGLWRSVLALGQHLQRTSSSIRVRPQPVTEIEFNTIEDASTDTCVIEITHNDAKEEDDHANAEKEGHS